MRRFLKIVALTLLALVGLVIVAVAGALVWLQTDAGQERVASEIEARLQDALAKGSVHVGRLRVGLRSVTLEDLRLDGEETEDVVTIASVRARFDPLALLEQRIELRYLLVVEPRVRLVPLGDGYDLPRPVEGNGAADEDPRVLGAWSLIIDRLVVDRGQVSVMDPSIEVRGIDLAGALAIQGKSVTLEALVLSSDVEDPAIGEVRFEARELSIVPADAQVAARGVAATASGLDAQVEGTVDHYDELSALAIDATAELRIERRFTERLARALLDEPPEIPPHPPTTVALDASGTKGELAVAVTAGPSADATLVASDVDLVLRDDPMRVRAEAKVEALEALEAYGAPALEGTAHGTLAGTIGDAFEGSGVPVLLDGAYADTARSSRAVVSYEVVVDEGIRARGGIGTTGIEASGWSVDEASGTWSLRALAEGPTAIALDLVSSGIDGASVRAATLRLEGDLVLGDPRHVEAVAEATGVTLGVEGFSHDGTAQVTVDGSEVSFTARLTDPAAIDVLGVRGRGDLESGAFVLPEVFVRPTPLVTWAASEPVRFRLADEGLVDLALELGSDKGRIVVAADRLGSRQVDGRLLVRDLELEHVHAVAERFWPELPSFSGTLDAGVAGLLSPSAGSISRLEVELDGQALTVADALSDVDLSLEADLVEDEVTATGLASSAGRTLVKLDGTVPVTVTDLVPRPTCGGRPVDLDLSLPETTLDRLRAAIPAIPETWAAELDVLVSLSGDPCAPIPELDAVVSLEVQDQDLRVVLGTEDSAEPDQVAVRTAVALDGRPAATLRARANLRHRATLGALFRGAEPPPLGRPDTWLQAWDGELRLLGVPLAILAPERLEGAIVGAFRAAGRGADLEVLQGEARLEEAQIADTPIHTASVSLHRDGSDLVTTIDLGLPEGRGLDATVRWEERAFFRDPMRAPFALDVTRGEIPLAFVTDIAYPAITGGEGVIEIAGELGGSLSDPRGDLTIRLEDGTFELQDTGVHYTNVDLYAKVEGTSLELVRAGAFSRPQYGRFAGTAEGHRVRASGTVTLAGGAIGRTDVQVGLEDFWLLATDVGLVSVSGDLALIGEWPELLLEGDVDVERAEIVLDKHHFLLPAATELHPDLRFVDNHYLAAERAELDEEEDSGPSLADAIDLDLDLALRQRVVLDATVPLSTETGTPVDLAEASVRGRLDGTLRIDVRNGILDLSGRLETEEATARLLSAGFDVEEGVIAFAGSDYTNPNVEFHLMRDVGTYGVVTAHVSGTPENLSVTELSSDQYGDEADVMALLLFGRPLSELGSSQGQAGGQMVERVLAGVLGQQIEEALGAGVVDTVSYDPTQGLQLGWALSTDLFLRVEIDPQPEEDENTTDAVLSWFIGRRLAAEFVTGDRGQSAARLLWETRF